MYCLYSTKWRHGSNLVSCWDLSGFNTFNPSHVTEITILYGSGLKNLSTQWIETPLCMKEPKAIPKPNDLIWFDLIWFDLQVKPRRLIEWWKPLPSATVSSTLIYLPTQIHATFYHSPLLCSTPAFITLVLR